MKNENVAVSFAVIMIALGLGYFLMHRSVQAPVHNTVSNSDSTVSAPPAGDQVFVLACDAGKSMMVTFHIPEDKTADVILSDGRTLSLPKVSPNGGVLYSNADASIILGASNNKLVLSENKKDTYTNCFPDKSSVGDTSGQK